MRPLTVTTKIKLFLTELKELATRRKWQVPYFLQVDLITQVNLKLKRSIVIIHYVTEKKIS